MTTQIPPAHAYTAIRTVADVDGTIYPQCFLLQLGTGFVVEVLPEAGDLPRRFYITGPGGPPGPPGPQGPSGMVTMTPVTTTDASPTILHVYTPPTADKSYTLYAEIRAERKVIVGDVVTEIHAVSFTEMATIYAIAGDPLIVDAGQYSIGLASIGTNTLGGVTIAPGGGPNEGSIVILVTGDPSNSYTWYGQVRIA